MNFITFFTNKFVLTIEINIVLVWVSTNCCCCFFLLTEFDSQVSIGRSDGEIHRSLHQAVCGQFFGHSLVPFPRLRLRHLHKEGGTQASTAEGRSDGRWCCGRGHRNGRGYRDTADMWGECGVRTRTRILLVGVAQIFEIARKCS